MFKQTNKFKKKQKKQTKKNLLCYDTWVLRPKQKVQILEGCTHPEVKAQEETRGTFLEQIWADTKWAAPLLSEQVGVGLQFWIW